MDIFITPKILRLSLLVTLGSCVAQSIWTSFVLIGTIGLRSWGAEMVAQAGSIANL